jgi:hypothetical protein
MTTLTDDQLNFIHELGCRYYSHMSDGWRCDFCEPDCNCDEIYVDGLVDDYVNKFLTTDNLLEVRDRITNF